MGAALGFGALAKLSIALVPLSLFVWVVLRTPRLIVTPGPYLGAYYYAVFVMTPWILWNVDRDFALVARVRACELVGERSLVSIRLIGYHFYC